MERILKDMEVLSEQGLNPHLWLQVTRGSRIENFDGYACLEDLVPAQEIRQTPVFIRIADIEDFTIASLETIRKYNYKHYKDGQASYYMYRASYPWDAKSATSNFFRGCLGLRAKTKEEDINRTVLCTLDLNTVQIEGETVTYKEALQEFYDELENEYVEEGNLYEKTKGGIYYSRCNEDFLAALKGEKKPFNPTGFTFAQLSNLGFNDKVTLKDNDLSYPCDIKQAYGYLAYYKDKVEGLSEVLDEMLTKHSALVLAGVEENLTPYTLLEGEPYLYSNGREQNCQIVYHIPSVGTLMLDTLGGDRLDAVQQSRQNAQDTWEITPIFSNLISIEPLFISKIEFIEGYLEILVRCRVKLCDSAHQYLDLPLVFANITGYNLREHKAVISLDYSTLSLPIVLLPYIKTDYNMEELLGENLLKHQLKQQTYAAIHIRDTNKAI